MEPYIVREGDHLLQIAAQRGFDALDVWNDPKNKSLRDEGREPHLLAAGDLLWVPEAKPQWLPVRVGQVNRFTTPTRPMRIDIVLSYGGTPLANEPYMVGTDPPATGTTDASGLLTATVRAQTKELTVKVPRLALTILLQIGHLDPIATVSGVHQRLRNLGHLGPELAASLGRTDEFGVDVEGNPVPVRTLDDDPDRDDRSIGLDSALRRFQAAAGLAVTGELDDATRAALLSRHGS